MSEDTLQQVDTALVSQISGLIEFRKSKLRRLESVYVNGRSKVEAMHGEIKDAKRNQVKFKQSIHNQIQVLTDTYLGGGHSPVDIQKWFSTEKHLKEKVVKGQAGIKQKEGELRQLKKVNQEEKKAYQHAMTGVEKMNILKEELLNGTA